MPAVDGAHHGDLVDRQSQDEDCWYRDAKWWNTIDGDEKEIIGDHCLEIIKVGGENVERWSDQSINERRSCGGTL